MGHGCHTSRAPDQAHEPRQLAEVGAQTLVYEVVDVAHRNADRLRPEVVQRVRERGVRVARGEQVDETHLVAVAT